MPPFATGNDGLTVPAVYPPMYSDPAKSTFFDVKIAMQFDDLSKLPLSGQGIKYSRTGYTLSTSFSMTALDTYAQCALATVQKQRTEISQALQIDPSRIIITCFGIKGKPDPSPSSMSDDGQSEALQSLKERQLLQVEGSCRTTAHFRASFSLPPGDLEKAVQGFQDFMQKKSAAVRCSRPGLSFEINTVVAVEADGDFGCQDFVEQLEAQQILEASSVTCGDFFGAGEAILMSSDGRSLTSPSQLTGGNLAGVTTERVKESDWMDTGRPFLWVWVLIAAVGLLLWCFLPCFVFLLVRLRSKKKAKLVSTGTNTTPRRAKYDNEVFCSIVEEASGTIKGPSWAICPSKIAQDSVAGPGVAQSSSFGIPLGAQGAFLGICSSFSPRGEPDLGSSGPAQQSHGRWRQPLLQPPKSSCRNAHCQPSTCARSYPVTEESVHDEHEHDVRECSSPGGRPHAVFRLVEDSCHELPVLKEGMEVFTMLDTKRPQAGRALAPNMLSGSLANTLSLKSEPPYSHEQEPTAKEAVAENSGGGCAQKEKEVVSLPRIVLRSLSPTAPQGQPAHLLQAGSSKSSRVQPDPASTNPSKGAPFRTSNTSSCSRNSAANSCSNNQTAHRLRTGSRSSQVQPFPATITPSKGAPSCTSNTSPYPRTGAADSCTSTDTSFSSYNSPNPAAMPHCAQASMARGMDALLAPSPAPAGRQDFHIAGGTRRAASCTMPTLAGLPHPGRTIFGIGSVSAPRGDVAAGTRGDPAAGAGGGLAAGAKPGSRECWNSSSQNETCVPKEEDMEDKSWDSPARPVPLPAGLVTSAEPLLPIKLDAPASATDHRPSKILPGTPEQMEQEVQARNRLFHGFPAPGGAMIPIGPGIPQQPSQRPKSFTYTYGTCK